MRCALVFLLVLGCGLGARAAPQNPPEAQPPAPAPAPPPETEVIGAPPPKAAAQAGENELGYKDAAQVAALLHNVWLVAFRVNDLLTEVHPERWKLDEAASSSFAHSLDGLRAGLASVDDWRAQFEKRTDSMYLGYEIYTALGAVLPRLDGVAKAIVQHENASLAAQYSQAGSQLFDAQQALEPYLDYLSRTQDQLLLASQTNLAACENQLSYAMRSSVKPATPMPNVLPAWPKRHVQRNTRARARVALKATKKPELKPPAASRPKAAAPSEPGQNTPKQ